jgi:Rieske Fe-S protein
MDRELGSSKEHADGKESASERRGFLQLLAGLAIAVVLWPSRRVQARTLGLPLSKLPKLAEVGGSMRIELKGREILFVRDTEKTVRAFNPTCTHQQCTVKFKEKTGKLHCPCHYSAYDLDGTVLEGPAPHPLEVFSAKLDGDSIVLDLPDAPPTSTP